MQRNENTKNARPALARAGARGWLKGAYDREIWFNAKGYPDPTAGAAITRVMLENARMKRRKRMLRANKNISDKVAEYARLRIAAEEMNGRAQALAETVKQWMTEKGVQELQTGEHTVLWQSHSTRRLDMAALKTLLGEEQLQPLMKQSIVRRFIVK